MTTSSEKHLFTPALYVTADIDHIFESILHYSALSDNLRVLGLDAKLNPKLHDVENAYQWLIRRVHPDKNPSNTTRAGEAFKEVGRAHDELRKKGGLDAAIEKATKPPPSPEKPVPCTLQGRPIPSAADHPT